MLITKKSLFAIGATLSLVTAIGLGGTSMVAAEDNPQSRSESERVEVEVERRAEPGFFRDPRSFTPPSLIIEVRGRLAEGEFSNIARESLVSLSEFTPVVFQTEDNSQSVSESRIVFDLETGDIRQVDRQESRGGEGSDDRQESRHESRQEDRREDRQEDRQSDRQEDRQDDRREDRHERHSEIEIHHSSDGSHHSGLDDDHASHSSRENESRHDN